jgi:coenzyme F420-dependent glucose-6-phosphate dehydrogenase
MDRMIEMKVSFDTDRDRALEDPRCGRARCRASRDGVHDPRELEVLAKDAEPYAHRRWLVSSDPDEHVEQIAPYVGWGFNHLVFHFPGEDQEDAITRYAELVLPRLRARFG